MDFIQWYLIFRKELAARMGVNYTIYVASWTYSDVFKPYYDDELTPKDAVKKYISNKSVKLNG